MSTNFHLAPPSKTVDGLLCVPIDIQSINAVFTFEAASMTATADATISYTLGPTAGNPIFDLRQMITEAFVDGAVFPAAKLAHHNFGAGAFTDLRVIESVQAAGIGSSASNPLSTWSCGSRNRPRASVPVWSTRAGNFSGCSTAR